MNGLPFFLFFAIVSKSLCVLLSKHLLARQSSSDIWDRKVAELKAHPLQPVSHAQALES